MSSLWRVCSVNNRLLLHRLHAQHDVVVSAQIREIVLTGGPCAGKTTAVARLSSLLADRSWHVICAPEAASTLFGTTGLHPSLLQTTPEAQREFQRSVLLFQTGLRRSLRSLASASGRDTVILYDRAELDGVAYAPYDLLSEVARSVGVSLEDCRSSYDLVVHLRTAALGAPEAYTLANNAARIETPEEAIALDERTLRAWEGSERLVVCENDSDFETKLQRVASAVLRALGDTMPFEIERKWWVRAPFEFPPELHSVTLDIVQVYLPSDDPDVEMRVRSRRQFGETTYVRTLKKGSGVVRQENESVITRQEYQDLLELNPGAPVVVKTRHVFSHAGHVFELDNYESHPDLWVLEAELADPEETVELPAFLHDLLEVTDDPRFKNAALAVDGPPEL